MCSFIITDTDSLDELLTAIIHRLGAGYNRDDIQLLVSWAYVMLTTYKNIEYWQMIYYFCLFLQYEDDEGDQVLLVTDSDLVGAANNARSLGIKVLWTHFIIFLLIFNIHHSFWFLSRF